MEPPYEVGIRRDPIRTQPIVELGKPRDQVTIGDTVDFILKTSFDPNTTTYEFPILGQQPYSYDSLRNLANCHKCEVAINSVVEDGQWTTRVMTGFPTNTSIADILPVDSISKPNFLGKPVIRLRVPNGDPIVDDHGNFSGEKWEVDVHNHPNTKFEGPPYPSAADLKNGAPRAKTNLLVSTYGLTIYGPIGETLNIPDELKDRVTATNPEQFLANRGDMNEIGYYQERKGLISQEDKDLNRSMWVWQKGVCEALGAPFRVLRWDEDKAEIESVLDSINHRTFNATDYLNQAQKVVTQTTT